jgi:hypothetical protein
MSYVYDAITLALLAIAVILASVAIWWGERLLLSAATQPTATKPSKYKWLHVVGLILFMNGMYLFSFFPLGAFLLAGLAYMASVYIKRAPRPVHLQRDGYFVLLIVGFAWLAYGTYELHLNEWKETVVGAPIRIDFLILAPLFYVATMKAYAIFKLATEAARGPKPK